MYFRSDLKGLVINGDLTAYGHESEFNNYWELWQNPFKDIIYPGLGNHDYDHNVGNCFHNNCAKRMCAYIVDWYSEKLKHPYTRMLTIDYAGESYNWFIGIPSLQGKSCLFVVGQYWSNKNIFLSAPI